MRRYSIKRDKLLWCEKTPCNVDYLSILDKAFPDAKYLCLFRNCLDTTYSHLRLFNMNTWVLPYYQSNDLGSTVQPVVRYWIETTRKIIEFKASNLERCFQIAYEELISQPEKILKDMFNFIGVEWDYSYMDLIFTSHHDHGGGGDPNVWFTKRIDPRNIGNGAKISLEQIDKNLIKQVNELHFNIGYPALEEYYSIAHCPEMMSKSFELSNRRVTVHDIDTFLSQFHGQMNDIGGSCRLVVQGLWNKSWLFHSGDIIPYQGDIKPDCVVTLSTKTFEDLRSGRLNPARAFAEGNLVVNGAKDVARKLGILLFSR